MFAVELSSFQLHYTDSMSAESAAVLNVAPDHLDWYADLATYAADKGRIYEQVQRACVYNVADPATERLVREADVVEGARAIGFTLGMPGVGMLGVVDDILADRAFVEAAGQQRGRALHDRRPGLARPRTSSPTRSPPRRWPAPTASRRRGARRACAASAPTATGSRWSPSPTGVTWVDDSKATNPHAAQSSLQAYDRVVWVAGGLAKGARFDDLVRAVGAAAAGRRAPRRGPRGHRRRPFATRARCARHRHSRQGD